MPFDAHKNLAVAQAANAPGTGGTSLVVGTGQGARFPAAPFNATVYPAGFTPDPTNAEIVRVTSIAGDTLTITRAQEGTTARNIGVGDVVSAGVTAKTLADIELPVNGRAAASASFSTVVTQAAAWAAMAGEIVPGAVYEFMVRAQVINTTATSNLVAVVRVGGTTVVTLTQALGATARATPGGAVILEGTLSFYSATQAEATIRAFTASAVAFDVAVATTAPVTVAASGAVALDVALSTSAATSTVIVRESFFKRV